MKPVSLILGLANWLQDVRSADILIKNGDYTMRRIFVSSLILFLSFSFITQEASARGFGGRGFSMARARPAFSRTFHQKRPTTSPAKNNKWRGALTGFMLGSLLTSLFMGHGFGSGLMAWLLLGALVWLVMNVLKQRKTRQED